jgi:hypothetical protein
MSDETGDYTLEVPGEDLSTITVTSDVYYPHLYAFDPATENVDDVGFGIASRDMQAVLMGSIGVDPDATEGSLHVRIATSRSAPYEYVEGATVTLDGGYDDLHYWGADDATSDSGTLHFTGVDEGDHTLTVSHPELDCVRGKMTWSSEGANEAVVAVRDGYASVAWFVCS